MMNKAHAAAGHAASKRYRSGGQKLYIPIAVHKNELVVINDMETFSRYFCLAKKQKMTPLVTEEIVATPEELESERGFIGGEEHVTASSDGGTTDAEEDDI
jgi:hypothetical protein